jgi:hypothetical protein
MRDHFDILPPMIGQQVYVDSADETAGYYEYDGEDWNFLGQGQGG